MKLFAFMINTNTNDVIADAAAACCCCSQCWPAATATTAAAAAARSGQRRGGGGRTLIQVRVGRRRVARLRLLAALARLGPARGPRRWLAWPAQRPSGRLSRRCRVTTAGRVAQRGRRLGASRRDGDGVLVQHHPPWAAEQRLGGGRTLREARIVRAVARRVVSRERQHTANQALGASGQCRRGRGATAGPPGGSSARRRQAADTTAAAAARQRRRAAPASGNGEASPPPPPAAAMEIATDPRGRGGGGEGASPRPAMLRPRAEKETAAAAAAAAAR